MAGNPDTIILQPDTKEQVRYRQHESCKTCGQFNGRGKCNLVQGNISPDAVCDKWTLMETPSRMTGKEFIQAEYQKANNVPRTD